MPLNNIPVLGETYPLYDWSDWQSSRDALVSGTPTKLFAKEAWNAIVDGLSEALEAAGEEWDATYTTAEEAKITVAYGKLTAQKFNSVRHNIDRPAPLGWAWANNSGFRGYVGREDFHGRTTHGNACDLVYPEYIIELVRKLNLLLEIMRGTALLSDAEAEQISSVSVEADVWSLPAAHVETEHISTVTVNTGVMLRPSASVEAAQRSITEASAEVISLKAAQGEAELLIPLLLDARGQSKRSALVEPDMQLMHTQIQAESQAIRCVETSAAQQSATIALSEVNASEAIFIEEEIVSTSSYSVELSIAKALPGSAEIISRSRPTAEVKRGFAVPVNASSLMGIQITAEAGKQRVCTTESACLCGTRAFCELDTAWYPPVWVNGGLWIRQSHSVTQTENGELVIV